MRQFITKDDYKLELKACISAHTCMTEDFKIQKQYLHSRFMNPSNSAMFQQGIKGKRYFYHIFLVVDPTNRFIMFGKGLSTIRRRKTRTRESCVI